MRTKFLCVRPANRGDTVSVGFILSFLPLSLTLFYLLDWGFMLLFWQALLFISCYLIFGTDRVKSMRWVLYQFRNSRQTVNHKDTFYCGDDFYKVSPFKDVVTVEVETDQK